jgi:uncharacterized protein (DUF433 family)
MAVGAVMDFRAIPHRVARPLYSYADADQLASVSRGTAKRWIAGYTYRNPQGECVASPSVTPGIQDHGNVSFADLIEIIVIGRLKSIGFSVKGIRKLVQNCQTQLNISRPLTTLKFKADGHDLFVNQGDTLLGLGKRRGQRAWNEILGPFLEDVDYTDAFVSRWWPLGRDKPIVVDPEYGYGLPVVADSGVRTEIILERFQAGDLRDQIAQDFNIDSIEVERALQFELKTRAA